MRRVDVVADHLQREIGLDAGADVERAVVEERPAAVVALDAAEIDGDLALELSDPPARRGNGGSRMYSAGMVASASSSKHQWPSACRSSKARRSPRRRGGRARQARRRSYRGRAAAIPFQMPKRHLSCGSPRRAGSRCQRISSAAAVRPERIAPSMVAGRPVSVQSPASTRFANAVRAPGRRAASAGVAAKVARRSRTICQRRHFRRKPGQAGDFRQIASASACAARPSAGRRS